MRRALLAISSDDAGHPLKTVVAALLDELGVAYVDVGVDSAEPPVAEDPVDYPDVAARVATSHPKAAGRCPGGGSAQRAGPLRGSC